MDERMQEAALILALDEPEALLGAIKRIAAAKASDEGVGRRWRDLATVLTKAVHELDELGQPKPPAAEPDESV